MPELPEVETTMRLVRPHVVGRAIERVDATWPRTVGGDAKAFARAVRGARIVRAWRRAKWIVFDLEGGSKGAARHILVHLRMTGRLVVEPSDAPPPRWWKVALHLDDGRALWFLDVRKFGRVHARAARPAEFDELGPEPLSDEFDGAWLHAALLARRRALKPLLLDQSFLAGLGNIYVDESLHAVGLHPLADSSRTTREQAERLAAAIKRVLAAAIEREGSSFDAFYRTPEGNPGSYQDQFLVYGREGEPCRTCGASIRKFVVGQRGTHACPRCQPAPRGRAVRKR
jgi:formamidopyrimidine-DNA glycosylase